VSRELLMFFLFAARGGGGRDGDSHGATDKHRLDSVRLGNIVDANPDRITPEAADKKASSPAAKRAWEPEPVDRHAEAQSRRIVSLVAELQAAEEQQMRLQRDLATLRASMQHGGETLHPKLLDGEGDLPVLSVRVPGSSAAGENTVPATSNPDSEPSSSRLLGLSMALDSTAEIPVMAEEELADSIDELELEYIGEADLDDRHV